MSEIICLSLCVTIQHCRTYIDLTLNRLGMLNKGTINQSINQSNVRATKKKNHQSINPQQQQQQQQEE